MFCVFFSGRLKKQRNTHCLKTRLSLERQRERDSTLGWPAHGTAETTFKWGAGNKMQENAERSWFVLQIHSIGCLFLASGEIQSVCWAMSISDVSTSVANANKPTSSGRVSAVQTDQRDCQCRNKKGYGPSCCAVRSHQATSETTPYLNIHAHTVFILFRRQTRTIYLETSCLLSFTILYKDKEESCRNVPQRESLQKHMISNDSTRVCESVGQRLTGFII